MAGVPFRAMLPDTPSDGPKHGCRDLLDGAAWRWRVALEDTNEPRLTGCVAFGWAVEGVRPDRADVAGAALCLLGAAVILLGRSVLRVP